MGKLGSFDGEDMARGRIGSEEDGGGGAVADDVASSPVHLVGRKEKKV